MNKKKETIGDKLNYIFLEIAGLTWGVFMNRIPDEMIKEWNIKSIEIRDKMGRMAERYVRKEKLRILQKYLEIVRNEKENWDFQDYDEYPTARLLESIEEELAEDIENTTSHPKG